MQDLRVVTVLGDKCLNRPVVTRAHDPRRCSPPRAGRGSAWGDTVILTDNDSNDRNISL